ncbi:hypothetical protein C8R46DRAFT_1078677 [Mycena filopes]|nr:hypothetical protein C8R46DRAFT_1078677 [Mycena filopes]
MSSSPPLPTSSTGLRIRSARLAPEITELQIRLAVLLAEHEHVQSKLDSIIYPVLQLPPEITAEIFVRCIPRMDTHPRHALDKTGMLLPTRLASVCRDWRTIAFSTPQIWCSMNICLNPKTHTDSDIDFERRFSLGGDCPLSLELFWLPSSVATPNTGLPLLEIATAHCRNWESVKIDLIDKGAGLVDKIKGALPLLRELHLCVYTRSVSLGDAFSDAPRLRDLTITVFNTNFHIISAVNFPWAQLTTFNANGLSVEDCFHVLRLASQLESCTFSEWFGVDDGIPDTPLLLPNLRNLRLLTPERFRWFLDGLTLPLLEELHVYILPRQVPSFCDFISRSGCSLRDLGLGISSALTPGVLLQLWEAVPTVMHIDVSPSRRDVLPRLRSVVVRGQPNRAMDHQLLVNMLRSRQLEGDAQSLRSFGLFTAESRNILPREVSQLLSIAKVGMNIEMDVAVPFQALISGLGNLS